jgi:hypothetical protein
MRRSLAIAIFSLVSILPASLLARQSTQAPPSQQPVSPPVVTQDAQSVTVATAAIGALGGGALVTAPRTSITVLISGTYTDIDMPAPNSFPMRIKVFGLDQIRWEVDMPEGTYVTLIIGGSAWQWGPKSSATLPISGLFGHQLEMLPLLALADWISSTAEVSLQHVGQETLNGRTVDHLAISRAPAWIADPTNQSNFQKMSKKDIYLDSQTHLPAELDYNEHPRDSRVNTPVRLVFSNYAKAGNFIMPMTVDRWVMGVKLGEYNFTSVTFGASINPADFEVN